MPRQKGLQACKIMGWGPQNSAKVLFEGGNKCSLAISCVSRPTS